MTFKKKTVSRTAPAKDTTPAATSGQSASTPTAASVPDEPSPKVAEAATPQGSNAVGVTLVQEKPVTVTASAPLRDDGPTLEQYVAAGYKAESYPPQGYKPRTEQPRRGGASWFIPAQKPSGFGSK